MFDLRFSEDTGEFEITNQETGKVASIPDYWSLWSTNAESTPNVRFYEQNGILVSTKTCPYNEKEITLYNEEDGWLCRMRCKNSFFWLREQREGELFIASADKIYLLLNSFNNDQMNTDQIWFRFYDLETKQEARLSTVLMEEPDIPSTWYAFTPDEPNEGTRYLEPEVQEVISRLKADVKLLSEMSQKHSETQIKYGANFGWKKIFKSPQNGDGLLFEFWDSKPDKSRRGQKEFEHLYQEEILFVRDKTFFRKRADIDTSLHSSNGVEIYQTPDGLQIEDSERGEILYYIEHLDQLIRTRADWESIPIGKLNDQFQIFDMSRNGAAVRLAPNGGGHYNKEIPIDMERLAYALQTNNLELFVEVYNNRHYDYESAVTPGASRCLRESQIKDAMGSWAPFPEVYTSPGIAHYVGRTITNYADQWERLALPLHDMTGGIASPKTTPLPSPSTAPPPLEPF